MNEKKLRFLAWSKNRENKLKNDYQRLRQDLLGKGRRKPIKSVDLDNYFKQFNTLSKLLNGIKVDSKRYNDPYYKDICLILGRVKLFKTDKLRELNMREANAYSESPIANIIKSLSNHSVFKSAEKDEQRISILKIEILKNLDNLNLSTPKDLYDTLEKKLRYYFKFMSLKSVKAKEAEQSLRSKKRAKKLIEKWSIKNEHRLLKKSQNSTV